MKKERHALIMKAVAEENIATQEQLRQYLLTHGTNATQATVSRDIKDLRLTKTKRQGQNCYQAAEELIGDANRRRQRAMFASVVQTVDSAGHTVCLLCSAGMAQGVAAALDAMRPEGVIGSLAGDDTIFLLCRSEAFALQVQEEIQQYAAKLDD
ncbi:MAG: arginine repressor [Oscillospiraceae bacterium]|jgi:transcriptional regulator of arginine metabolism|nr:arginine repressor [Oscillospiraceae bacterium]